MAENKNVAKAGSTAVAAYDYGEMAGQGFEGTQSSELSIPFITVLQALSEQVEKNNPEGAAAGMLYNTVTNELIDGSRGLVLQPVHKNAAYVQWIKRDEGGGYVGQYDPEDPFVLQAIKSNNGETLGPIPVPGEDKQELIETYYVYCLILDEEGKSSTGFCVLSFTSTKISVFRKWWSAMYMLKGRPPLIANRAKLTTVGQTNSKNQPFKNFQFEPFADNWMASLINPGEDWGRELLEEANQFREMVLSGAAKAAHDTEQSGGATSDGAEDSGDAPF